MINGRSSPDFIHWHLPDWLHVLPAGQVPQFLKGQAGFHLQLPHSTPLQTQSCDSQHRPDSHVSLTWQHLPPQYSHEHSQLPL